MRHPLHVFHRFAKIMQIMRFCRNFDLVAKYAFSQAPSCTNFMLPGSASDSKTRPSIFHSRVPLVQNRGWSLTWFHFSQTLILKSSVIIFSIHHYHRHFLMGFQLPFFCCFLASLFCLPAFSSSPFPFEVLIFSLLILFFAIFEFNCYQNRATIQDKS